MVAVYSNQYTEMLRVHRETASSGLNLLWYWIQYRWFYTMLDSVVGGSALVAQMCHR